MHPKTIALAVLVAGAARAGVAPAEFDAGEPVVAYNLALVPLYTRRPPPYEDYTVLEEAHAARAVSVREMPGGAEVPRLMVQNKDRRALYLLGGEVVLGGQQDRMVMVDAVVDPGTVAGVPVVCVEHGRWSGADLTFRASGALGHSELRRAALFGGQGQVWDEVARKARASGLESRTGTFRRVVQDAGVRGRIGKYLDELQGRIPRSDRLAGVAFAVDGELEVVDLFDSPRLYQKLERKLLASYVLAALERQRPAGAAAGEKARALKRKDVEEFVGGGQEKKSSGKIFRSKGKDVHGTWFK